MSSWDDHRLTCMHGIKEELDYHTCSECQEIARKLHYDFSKGQTYIFQSKPKDLQK